MKKILSLGAFLIVFIIIAFIIVAFKDKDITPVVEKKILKEEEISFSYEEEYFREETDRHIFNIKYPKTNIEDINNEFNLYIEDLKNIILESEDSDFIQSRSYVLDTSFDVKESDKYITFIFQSSVDTGGAHPNVAIKTFTYTTEGEKVDIFKYLKIEFDDVFLIDNISTVVKDKLRSRYDDEYIYEQIERGAAPSYENFELFYEEDGEIYFIFPPYSVGPYALGIQEVSVSKSYLENEAE